jgi:hypothetical protein
MNRAVRRPPLLLFASCFAVASVPLQAIDLLPADSPVQIGVSALVDLETYVSDLPAQGLLFENDEVFLNPRLTLFADLHFGDHVSGFVQARLDRGFDPGARADGDIRLDEYALTWKPFDEPLLNVRVGKFATIFGNWVPRHLSWDNPFITAPVPYENVVGIADHVAPLSQQAFLTRKTIPDKKREWLPVLWGPVYAHGASVFGRIEGFDYAFEIKSASISSRPYAWDARHTDWDAPTVSGRLGYRPNAAWDFGTSFSTGAYMLADPDNTLPRDTDRDDFTQDTIGFDLRYSRHHFELWAELMLSRFEVPRVGDADTVTYYVEAKYKITESLFVAARWNQQFFDDVPNGRGGEAVWDRDLFRADLAVGYRFSRQLQTKLQYSYGHERGPEANGDHLLAAQVTWKLQ